MIFLVVLLHCGLVYDSSGIGYFFWIVYDPTIISWIGMVNTILDIFVMATIFFIAGYLTPSSLKNKTGWKFIKSKLKRLILPWIIAVLILMPLYKIIFLASRNMPQAHWTTYFHWNNGIFSQSWLWFLPVLFLFDVLYVILSKLKIKLPNITLKQAVPSIFFIGLVYSIYMDVFGLQGWTKNAFTNFQNERTLIYFMVFLLGALCHNLNVFETTLKNRKIFIAILCTGWIPVVLYYHYYSTSTKQHGLFMFSEFTDTILMWLNFHLSLLGLLYLVINIFRYYLNKQGEIIRDLNKNSYYVYIIHVILMGGFAWTMLNTSVPSLLKFFLLTICTYAISNLFISFSRKMFTIKQWRKSR